MSHPNDDMVIRPDLGSRDTPAGDLVQKRERAETLRKLRKGRKSLLRRAAEYKAIRKGRKWAKRKVKSKKRAFTKAAVATATVSAVVTALAAGVRLLTGRTLEGLSNELNESILGAQDDKARAGRRAREDVLSDAFAPLYGVEGVRDRYRDRFELYLNQELGRSSFGLDERFDVEGRFDMLAHRLTEAFGRGWAKGGAEGLRRCQQIIGHAAWLYGGGKR